jgi:hypothetical protein
MDIEILYVQIGLRIQGMEFKMKLRFARLYIGTRALGSNEIEVC